MNGNINSNNLSQFIVWHLSARREYDVAKILNENSILEKLFTDGYYNTRHYPLFKLLDKILPAKIINTYKQYQPLLSDDKVIGDWNIALQFKLSLAIKSEGNFQAKVSANKLLQKKIIKYLSTSNSAANNFYGFDTASLELFEWLKKNRGTARLFLEQCGASRGVTIKMHERFQEILGLDEGIKIEECLAMQKREQAEWQLADKIIVPSQFVYDEALKDGAQKEKLTLINYGYDPKYADDYIIANAQKKFLEPASKTIKVLFCGNAGFRKGIHDLLKVASMLKGNNVEFRVAGNIESRCLPIIKAYNLESVKFIGKVNFKAIQVEYAEADIFMLPSYIEGSAMVNFEAMSWALPIVTTYESGCILQNKVNGFVSRAGDVDDLHNNLQQLINSAELRLNVGLAAMQEVKNYSIKAYETKLISLLTSK